MDPGAGLLRIVTGLGTRAVDRPDHDYPRLANLDRPDVHMQNSAAERHRFSQRIMDVLDTGKNELTAIEIDSLLESLPLWFKKAVMERDYDAGKRAEKNEPPAGGVVCRLSGTSGESELYRADAESPENSGPGIRQSGGY